MSKIEVRASHLPETLIQVSNTTIHPRGSHLELFLLIIVMTSLVSPSGSSSTASSLATHLARQTDRLCRYKSHFHFLSTCIDQHLTPKGMRLNFGFDALPKSDVLVKTISRTIEAAERDILMTCRDNYSILADNEVLKFNQTLLDLQQTTDFYHLESILKHRRHVFLATKKKYAKIKGKKMASLREKNHTPMAKQTADPQQEDPRHYVKTKRCRRFYRRRTSHSLPPTNVVNLSKVSLTPEQLQVLALGPKFCPTPLTHNKQQLVEDVEEGCRRVRLKEMFFHEDTQPTNRSPPKFYKKTFYQPPPGRDKMLDLYCDNLKTRVLTYNTRTDARRLKDNLNKPRRQALQELRSHVNERTIRISTADKGGSVVVQDIHNYITEATRQLDNTQHYTQVTKDPTKQIAKHSNDIVEELYSNNLIDSNTQKWALTDVKNCRPQQFYTLPKIHKTLNNPPGRPIVSGIGGPTEKLSKLMDHWLQNFVSELPSHIKDSTHMLQIISQWNIKYGPFPSNTRLVTIDVVSLYTNIPHQEVETTLRHFLTQAHPHNTPPAHTLIDIAKHILTNNFFHFEGKIYKQISGTAMGTPMAPAIANLFMGLLEENLLSQAPTPIQTDLWRRFIDDIFLLWTGEDTDLQTLCTHINSFHPSIKFTVQSSPTHISFLDISVKLVNGYLETDMHYKPTDSHAYLHYSSCHPKHCKTNIPYSLFLRARRLCSLPSDFNYRCTQIQEFLINRGYPPKTVHEAMNRVKMTPRLEALKYTPKHTDDRTPFIITHNPRNPPLHQWLREGQHTLQSSSRMQRAMPLMPVVGERNARTLSTILMPSVLPPNTPRDQQPGSHKCDKTCVICREHLINATTFSSDTTSETFTIRHFMTCTSTNIIYLLFCRKCQGAQYIGETQNTLKTRFYLHRSHITKNTGTHVTQHFNSDNHTLQDMQCLPIEQVHSYHHHTRHRREQFWIQKLKTSHPFGLNTLE